MGPAPSDQIGLDLLAIDEMTPDKHVRPAHVMPLWEFPAWKQQEIAEAVAQPRPPARWLPLGRDFPGDRPLAWITSRAWHEWYWQRGIDPDKRRTSLSPAVREYVKERDEMVCGICGYFVPDDECHIDHIHPVVHGGSDAFDNLRVTHARCNLEKGAKI